MGVCETPEYGTCQKDCRSIAEYAHENHADVIVFEYLEMKGKISGKKQQKTASLEETGDPDYV